MTEEPINNYPVPGTLPAIPKEPIDKYPIQDAIRGTLPTITEEPIDKYPIQRPSIQTEKPVNDDSFTKTEMCTDRIEDLPIGNINGLVQTEFMRVWGCNKDSRIYRSHDECERNCRDQPEFCSQPEDPGRCRAFMPMWFWDPMTKNCRPFGYGGCGGNKNRFRTQEYCLKICGENKKEPEQVCPSFATNNVRNGYWKCSLDHDDQNILFNIFPHKSTCGLYCDGKDLASFEQMRCFKGKWMRVNIPFQLKFI